MSLPESTVVPCVMLSPIVIVCLPQVDLECLTVHCSVDQCGFQSLTWQCGIVAFSLWQCLAVWLGIGLTGVKNRRQLYGRDKKVIQSDQDYDDDGDGDNSMMMHMPIQL